MGFLIIILGLIALSINCDVVSGMIVPFEFTGSLTEGGVASATCIESMTSREFVWMKNGSPLNERKPKLSILNSSSTSTVIINDLGSEDSGNYTCVSKSRDQTSSFKAKLSIQSKPKWLVEPVNLKVVEDKQALLNCLAKGSPSVNIEWFIDSKKSIYLPKKVEFNIIHLSYG